MAKPRYPTTNPLLKTYMDTYQGLRQPLIQGLPNDIFSTNMGDVRARQQDLQSYLGQTDYAKQLEEAQNLSRLQLGLQLAQRGFAAAGATPREGESSFATVSRELFSPLAGDAGAIATQMMRQRQAINAAKRQEDRQLKLAALQQVQTEDTARRALAEKLMPTKKQTKPSVTDAPLYREIIGFDNGNPVYGPPVKTKAVMENGKLSQLRVDTGEKIKVGTDLGNYNLYERPRKSDTKAPTGIRSPQFQDSFRGMLSGIGDLQIRLDLGRKGIRFDPEKFSRNPTLTPGQDFPFSKVLGINADTNDVVTQPLSEEEQKTYAQNLRAAYFNAFKAFEKGEDPLDRNKKFVTDELKRSLSSLGRKRTEVPSGLVVPVTNPKQVTAKYKEGLSQMWAGQKPEQVIRNLPSAINAENLRSAAGRLKEFNNLGVQFGDDTISPSLPVSNATTAEVAERAAQVRERSSTNIQNRILAERLAVGTKLGGKLVVGVTDTPQARLKVVSEALTEERDRLAKDLSNPKNRGDLEKLDKSLQMLVELQRLDADMQKSGTPGFITGPLKGVFQTYFNTDITAWLKSEEGSRRQQAFLSKLSIVQQLFARDLLATTGEERYSNKDVEGAQKTLVALGEAGEFNADRLRNLRGYLKNLVASGLNAAGTMDIPAATLEKAAMLGVDLKKIQPKNGYYSPYLNMGNYAATKQPVPAYSQEYINNLRDNGIFGYAATLNRNGGIGSYDLIVVDDDNIPVPKDKKNPSLGYRTTSYPATRDDGGSNTNRWMQGVPKNQLDFNRSYLLNKYGLGN